MKATGSKLIKIAEAYGRSILKDVDTNIIVVNIDDKLFTVLSIEEAFNLAGKNPTPTGF